jgi:hypothetical protein
MALVDDVSEAFFFSGRGAAATGAHGLVAALIDLA